MKGFNVAGFLLGVCLLSLSSQHVSAVYTMAQTCQYFAEGYIADPSNCQNWGYCSGGSLLGNGTCPSGYSYDSLLGMCNPTAKVKCSTTVQQTCSSMTTTAALLADPNDCTNICYCNFGKSECEKCPQYQVFDVDSSSCVWSSTFTCAANSICRLVQNNKFVADPKTCGNYLRCVDGAGAGPSTTCSNGILFNPTTGLCDPNYKCNESPNNPSNPNLPPQTNPTICEGESGSAAVPAYVADGATCYGYYVCTGSDSGNWGSCPYGTHFDPKSETCVTPYTFNCEQNRCGNLNQQFVSQIGCEKYFICNNSKTSGQGACPDSAPYFDEFQMGCTKVKPDYPICTAS